MKINEDGHPDLLLAETLYSPTDELALTKYDRKQVLNILFQVYICVLIPQQKLQTVLVCTILGTLGLSFVGSTRMTVLYDTLHGEN